MEYHKVRIRSNGRIPFINRNGPINIPISLDVDTIENMRKVGIQVEFVEVVNTDSQGNKFPSNTETFATGDAESSVKTDSGKGNDLYLDRSKVVLPEGSHVIEPLTANIEVSSTAVPEAISEEIVPVATEVNEPIEDSDEDDVDVATSDDSEDSVDENVVEQEDDSSDNDEEAVEEAEPFRMKVYNDYYKMNAATLNDELEAIKPEVEAVTGKEMIIPSSKKHQLELVKQLIEEING